MANTNAPFGFRYFRGLGYTATQEQVPAVMAYNASATYFGDPVTATAAGGVARSASTGATPAALGIAGIFVGCKYLSVSQGRTVWSNYWGGSDVASTNSVEAYIINDPAARWVAQTDSTGAALADVNGTVGFVIGTGTVAGASGTSGAYIDMSTLNTSSYDIYNPFKIVEVINNGAGFPGSLGNGQAYDWVVVAFNNVGSRNFSGV